MEFMRIATLAMVAVSLSAGYKASAKQEGDVFVLHGGCTQLAIGDRDLSKSCDGKLISFTTPTGRVGFIFSAGEGIIQFSGQGERQSKLPSGQASQPIDSARFTPSGSPPNQAITTVASGSCSYGNPFAGKTRFSCVVTAGQGLWKAQFVAEAATARDAVDTSGWAASDSPPFEWPTAQPGAIPDLRIADVIKTARENARSGATRAEEGRRAAAQAHRHDALLGLVGAKPRSATIDDDTVVTTVGINGRIGRFATIQYDSGATLTGLVADGVGIYQASAESPLAQFSGWVFGASRASPTPMDGQFNFRNGEVFVGTSGGGHSYGVYTSADGERRFVGKIDLSNYPLRPVVGILQDRQGHLLANVNEESR